MQIRDDKLQPISIPLEQKVKLNVESSELLEIVTRCRCIVGNLIYITIPILDLSYVIGLVSHFL